MGPSLSLAGLDPTLPEWRAIFRAKLTERSASEPYTYAWVERTIDYDGTLRDADPGRSGTLALGAARELRDRPVLVSASEQPDVWMLYRGHESDGQPEYDFLAPIQDRFVRAYVTSQTPIVSGVWPAQLVNANGGLDEAIYLAMMNGNFPSTPNPLRMFIPHNSGLTMGDATLGVRPLYYTDTWDDATVLIPGVINTQAHQVLGSGDKSCYSASLGTSLRLMPGGGPTPVSVPPLWCTNRGIVFSGSGTGLYPGGPSGIASGIVDNPVTPGGTPRVGCAVFSFTGQGNGCLMMWIDAVTNTIRFQDQDGNLINIAAANV